MSEKDFETRKEEILEEMRDDGMNVALDYTGQRLYEDGMDAVNMSGGRKGGTIYLPNEFLAVLWDKFFRVQFSDGGWYDAEENQQLVHPRAYADAEIVVDSSLIQPRFESYTTHERIKTPLAHFEPVPHFLNNMVYIARLFRGDDTYDREDLEEELSMFDDMEFRLAEKENCSTCNPEIY